MADILLLEPEYSNKYPPLGLMKISYYHKHIKGDYVRFAKGRLPESLKHKKWDRVYITTLFTFEWGEYKKTIDYALEVAKDARDIYIGGIASTLMYEKFVNEYKSKPIKIITNLLNQKGKLGYEDDQIIDTLTPDYSILEDIRPHKYPFENAYFMYTTKGCGMNCGFCAVQTLEPEYIPYISIEKQIEDINDKYGEKKDLLLMDNNVLRSPKFNLIVNELKKLGFQKGAQYKSPLSGKYIPRYIDFNQGLDAFLLTEEKVSKLSELAIKPARIAFDHIEDKKRYEDAIKLCAKYQIKELSNYILYNSDAFKGKGNEYKADTPGDLYERLKFTIDLQDEINKKLEKENYISIFSFPMRYIPLNATARGYVGTEWNIKYLRAIQRILIPTQGKGVSRRSFFEASFGKDLDEYIKILAMPEDIIAVRGRFDIVKSGLKDETDQERSLRKQKWDENQSLWNEWDRLFNELSQTKGELIDLIKDNKFTSNKYLSIIKPDLKKIFLYYLSNSQFLLLLNEIGPDEDIKFIHDYCSREFPLYLKRIADYIYNYRISPRKLTGFIKAFGKQGLNLVLNLWITDNYKNDYLLDALEKAMTLTGHKYFDMSFAKTYKYYRKFDSMSLTDIEDANSCILKLDNKGFVGMLKKNFDKFRQSLNKSVKGSVGEKELQKQVEKIANEIYKQISIFDTEENM